MSAPTPTRQQDSQDSTEQEAEALAAAVATDFLLTDDEVAQLVDVILAARLTSYAAAYEAAADIADADYDAPASNDDLPASVQRRHQSAANAAAASIAATYTADLATRAATFTSDWLSDHDGSLDGAEDALRSDLAAYTEQRADWKADQVASYETGVGGNDGTTAAMDDLESGDLTDDNGDSLLALIPTLYVVILPEDSSSDFCSDYAGNIYAFDDAPSIDFPAHPSCQHYQVLITAAEIGDDEAPM